MSTEHPAAAHWPLARIRVTTPRVELRLPTDAELVEMADLAAAGIHPPEEMPFASPWSDAEPADIARGLLAIHWKLRGSWATGSGNLLLGVFVDGEVAGCQDIRVEDYGVLRDVSSGSWLGRRFHGQGLGTEMREAMLHLAFEGLEARAASSGAWFDNPASIRVSEKCGYERNGAHTLVRRRGPRAPGGASAKPVVEIGFRIEREAWILRRRDDIQIHGIDADVRKMLGMSAAD
ncbi:MAG: putative succinyl-CoA transferase [Thermoleophilia bacterium]|jgi:RimJ/RimL family protein N-acetyltransferase|nr:putative succinyl-CoA transferase [Thermoleophilia bacterium]